MHVFSRLVARCSFLAIACLSVAPLVRAQSGWTLTRPVLPEALGIGTIAYGNGRFVATLSGSSVTPVTGWSTDGVTWTAGPLRGSSGNAVVFVGGSFYLASDNTIYRSADGDAWQQVAVINGARRLNLIVTDGRGLLVGSNLDGWQPMFYSSDRVTFRQTAPLPEGSAPNLGQLDYLGAAGGRFFARAAIMRADNRPGGPIIVSTADGGATWSPVSAIPSTNVLTSGNGRLIAYGPISTNGGVTFADSISSTTDGVTFTHTPRPLMLSSSQTITGGGALAYAGGRFFFLGSFYASTDGAAWAPIATPPPLDSSRHMFAIAYGNGRYVATGSTMPTSPPFVGTALIATLVTPAAPVFATAPVDRAAPEGAPVTLSVTVEGSAAGLTYQWRRAGVALAGATTANYTIAAMRAADVGLYTVEVRNAFGSTTSDPALLTIGPATVAPTIAAAPANVTLFAGETATLAVAAGGTAPFTYQWFRDGVAIAGATAAALRIGAALSADAGSYTVSVTNAAGTVTSPAAALAVTPASRISNLSVLTAIATAGDSFRLGFVVGGARESVGKELVIRAVGPSLAAVGVAGALADPTLEVFAGVRRIGENDNWGGDPQVAARMAAVGAFPFSGPASRDAVWNLFTTTPDHSIAIAAADRTSTGLVLGEVYDASPDNAFFPTTPRLVNVSVLKSIGSGLTVGFNIAGTAPKAVLIRAIGPTLAGFGVSSPVVDPRLQLFRSGATQPLAANDDWLGTPELAAAFRNVGAFELALTSKDAALLTTLAPGGYSVLVVGTTSDPGSALVEVYEVP